VDLRNAFGLQGGFLVTLLYELPRATSNLDTLPIAKTEQRAPLLEIGGWGGAFLFSFASPCGST